MFQKEGRRMILTNTSALASQIQQTKAQENFNSAVRRISSGNRLLNSATDSGSLSQVSNLRSNKLLNQSYRNNLQNTRSYLTSQQEGLQTVIKVYDRMETLSLRAMDTTTTDDDRISFDKEFDSLVEKLQEIMFEEYQGRKLFSSSMVSGDGAKDIPIMNDFDLSDFSNKQGATNVVKAQSVDIGTNAGTISFRVNSGTDGDSYRIWLGDVCVFSAGSQYQGPKNDLGPHYDSIPFEDQGWGTSGNARNGDSDLIEVTFIPGQETTFIITPGNSNDQNGDGISNFNPSTNGSYRNVYTNPVPENFQSTELTLQIETDSIGIIYKKDFSSAGEVSGSGQGIEFKPIHPPLRVETTPSGDTVEVQQKGFGYFDEKSQITNEPFSLKSVEKATDTLNYLLGNSNYYGEVRSVIDERLSACAAEINRIDREIENLEDRDIFNESSVGKILDADIATEAINLAKSKIKSDIATQCISKSVRINDSLIELTTNHFDGRIIR